MLDDADRKAYLGAPEPFGPAHADEPRKAQSNLKKGLHFSKRVFIIAI
jgi:hypothetical protein